MKHNIFSSDNRNVFTDICHVVGDVFAKSIVSQTHKFPSKFTWNFLCKNYFIVKFSFNAGFNVIFSHTD